MAPLLGIVNEDVFFVAIPILSILVVLMTVILTNHYRKLQRDDMEATLKMEMIQRGMSAEEIEQVLAARLGVEPRRAPSGFGSGPPAGAPRHNA
jgi:hypothetical protein